MQRKIIALDVPRYFRKISPIQITRLICSKEGSINYFFDNETYAFSLEEEIRDYLTNQQNQETGDDFFLKTPINYFQNAVGIYISQEIFDQIELNPNQFANFEKAKKSYTKIDYSKCDPKPDLKKRIELKTKISRGEEIEDPNIKIIKKDITYHFTVKEKEEAIKIASPIFTRLNYKTIEQISDEETKNTNQTQELTDLNYESALKILGKEDQITLEAFLIRGYLSDHKRKLGHLTNVNRLFKTFSAQDIQETIEKIKKNIN